MGKLVVAQALVERGLLDTIQMGFVRARDQIDGYLGYSGSTYLILGAMVFLIVLIMKRRR